MTDLFKTVGFLCVAAALAVTAGAVRAQDASEMSASEIKERFNSQLTRGLVIAPAGGDDTPEPETEYVEVDPAEQINIRVSFDFDSAVLRESEKAKLATLCEAMQSLEVGLFRIVGHTDAAGSAEYNERLSLLRAEEVKRHMVGECGIDPSRLEAYGAGEAYPVDTTNPRSERNRRVEFQAIS